MAQNGFSTINAGNNSQITFSWEINTINIKNNTTTINWTMILSTNNTGSINSTAKKSYTVKVDGRTYTGTNTIGIGNGASKVLASGSTTIVHDADGKKTFSYSFSQQLDFYSDSLGRQLGTVSGSGSGTLEQIARYPTIKTAPNFTNGQNPTITFDLNGFAPNYDATGKSTNVMVCISLTKQKSDIAYRGLTADEIKAGSYTFSLTSDEQNVLNHSLTSTSRTVYFYVRTLLSEDKYNHSFLPATYTYKSDAPFKIKNDEALWVDLSTFQRMNTTGLNIFLSDSSADLCCLSNDFPVIALNYEQYLELNGLVLNKQVEIEFNGFTMKTSLGLNCTETPERWSDYTLSNIQPWFISMFGSQPEITNSLKLTFYNNIGDKVTTTRTVKILKYQAPTFTATTTRTSDTEAVISLTVDYTTFKYATEINGSTTDNTVSASVQSVYDIDGNDFTTTNVISSDGNLINITISGLSSGSYTVTGEIFDALVANNASTPFVITIPPVQRPINVNTQAVAIGGIINDDENDGRFKCGWPAYFNDGMYCNGIRYESRVLWDGTFYYDLDGKKVTKNSDGIPINGVFLNASQKIFLSETITEQMSGIVFVFSHYENGAFNACWQTHFVPKYLFEVDNTSKEFSVFLARDIGTAVGIKRITIESDGKTITGLDSNGQTMSGGDYVFPINNRYFVLRYIIGV